MLRLVFPKAYADRVARLRVPSGFLLVAAFAWFSHPGFDSLLAGIPISMAGLAIRAWAAGHLAKNETLATSGPYAYSRNPLYLGTLLVAAGLVIASRSIGLAILFAAVFVLIYLPVIELEEQHLRKLFPEYTKYAERVPRIWPGFGGARSPRRFRRSLYLRNQEYQALGGFVLGTLLLIYKAWNMW
jgi:protein-S-isoprenylcysteine O-methyltransferase Ste14